MMTSGISHNSDTDSRQATLHWLLGVIHFNCRWRL